MKHFNNTHRTRASQITMITSLLFLLSCGGSDSRGGGLVGFVTDVRVDPEGVRLNELASVRVDFNPSQTEDVLDDSLSLRDTEVVISLPPGVDYLVDSSEFDGSDVSGFRKRNPNHVEICRDGSRALTYSFSSGELTDNENSIRLEVTPYEGQGEVLFFALADDFISSPCDIFAEDHDILRLSQ